ncbi:MAG: bacterioferritin [Deltaproteobacteria bacterium]|nr:bacterioferritin [Deltaproteobacteria bacterium]
MPKKINQKIIKILTEVYTAEIGAIGIYMEQHAKCDNAGYKKLAERLKEDAVNEMKHAEALAERIVFLGAAIKCEKHLTPKPEETEIIDIVKMNLQIEIKAIERLNAGIKTCFNEGDNGSRLVLENILKDEEKHLDEYETILENIEKYGDQYIVTHLM